MSVSCCIYSLEKSQEVKPGLSRQWGKREEKPRAPRRDRAPDCCGEGRVSAEPSCWLPQHPGGCQGLGQWHGRAGLAVLSPPALPESSLSCRSHVSGAARCPSAGWHWQHQGCKPAPAKKQEQTAWRGLAWAWRGRAG